MIKKMVMAALTGRGVLKNDPPFKDLYGIVTRGVQFALVSTFNAREKNC